MSGNEDLHSQSLFKYVRKVYEAFHYMLYELIIPDHHTILS